MFPIGRSSMVRASSLPRAANNGITSLSRKQHHGWNIRAVKPLCSVQHGEVVAGTHAEKETYG
ncbi:MAG: hypothetical protein JW829_12150 [Pirellulales bacterium]|nr:hypothetical protein [Pirellulales bacterium]